MNQAIPLSFPAPPRVGLRQRAALFVRTPKGQALAAFVALVAVAGFFEAVTWPVILLHMLAAVVTAALFDLPFLHSETGRWQVPMSAILTGLIVGMILAPGTSLEIVVVASLVSILGKRLIRVGREHLFNPAVLGLLWVGWQFGSGESWWGALADAPLVLLPLLLVPGAYISHRLNKLPLVLTFGLIYFGLWTGASFVDPKLAAEMFRAPFLQSALFLALFMLTDPPTSPNRYSEQLAYGAVAAIGTFAATLLGAGQLYLLVATVAANVLLVIQRLLHRRRQRSVTHAGAGWAPRVVSADRDESRVRAA